MTEIIWEDPSRSRVKPTAEEKNHENSMRKYEPFVNQLKESPKRWAVFKRASSPTFSTRLKLAYPGIETTCRKVQSPDGKQRFDIYARWIG